MSDTVDNSYRMTELGPLPQEWQVVRLGEVVSLFGSPVNPCQVVAERYVGLEHIESGDIRIRRWGHPRDVRSLKTAFQPGDVIYGKLRPYLDKAALAEWEGICSTDILVLRPGESLFPEFFAYLVHTNAFLEYAIATMTGVNHPRTSWNALQKMRVPLPPLPEQRAIAHVLRTVQGAKEATERVIAALRELKKSLMRHLFTCGPVPVGDVGAQRRCAPTVPLQETDIGPIPAHWRVVRLGEVAEKPQYGYTTSATDQPVGPKFLRITDIQEGRVLWAAVPYCEIAQSDMERFLLKTGDILVARIGATTGKTFLVTECPPAVFASYLIRVRVLSEGPILPDFLWYYTNTPRYWEQINASKGGRLKQGINIPVLQNLLLPLPPLPEQRAIAEVLRAVDRKIEAEQARRQALEALFKALLHDLMTARRRLPPEFVARFGPPDPSSSQHSQEDVL